MKKNKTRTQPVNNLEIINKLYNALQKFAIGGTISANGTYEQAMNDTKNMAGLANIDAMQSSRYKDMQTLIQGVEMVTAMAGQLSSATGGGTGGMGDASGAMTGQTRQPVSTVNTITPAGSTVSGFAFGGNISKENTKPKSKYVPATRRDSLNVQKHYLNREKQLRALGYTKQYDSVGSYDDAHAVMYKDYNAMRRKEREGKTTEVIKDGYRNPMIYPSLVYREENIDNNPYLYKTQESTDIGVINPSVPYSLFDTRISPTKKERWVHEGTNDGVINYGYDFGEEYNPTIAKKGRTTAVKKNIVHKKPVVKNKNINYTRPIDRMAFGGTANVPVEVEGEEVGETPDGEMLDFQGPSHEQGGIPVSLPENTKIYSKRIEKFGETMAERKKNREKKLTNLNKLLETSKGDVAIRNAYKRSTEALNAQEEEDLQTQEMFKAMSASQEQTFAGGTDEKGIKKKYGSIEPEETDYNEFGIPDMKDVFQNQMFSPGVVSTAKPVNKNHGTNELVKKYSNPEPYTISLTDEEALNEGGKYDRYSNPELAPEKRGEDKPGTVASRFIDSAGKFIDESGYEMPAAGDIASIAGDAISAFSPMKNTLENRAGDTPNINAFKDYGKKGLDTLDKTKNYINQIRDEKLKDLELSRTSSIKRNQNSTRSINTARALNLVTDAGINNQKDEMYNTFAQQMMGILGQQSGMENQQDQVVMSGEQERDLNDRKDRDNFYTQLGKDKATMGEGIQNIGKDLNAMKQNNMKTNLINKGVSHHGLSTNSEGEITFKGKTQDEMTEEENEEAEFAKMGYIKGEDGAYSKIKDSKTI